MTLTRADRRELVIHISSMRFRRGLRLRRQRARFVLRMGWHR